MIKTVLNNVCKKYWGMIPTVLMITAMSQYRQERFVSMTALSQVLLDSLLPLLLCLVVVIPLEFHKLRNMR